MICTGIFKKEKDLYPLTPATERHDLWAWMITLTFGRDVAPLGDYLRYHELCPWGSTFKIQSWVAHRQTSIQDSTVLLEKVPSPWSFLVWSLQWVAPFQVGRPLKFDR